MIVPYTSVMLNIARMGRIFGATTNRSDGGGMMFFLPDCCRDRVFFFSGGFICSGDYRSKRSLT